MHALSLKFLGRFRDLGLLLIRLGLGAAFVVHGSGKMFHPEGWATLGGEMAKFGINFAPMAWGFAAAFSEFGGGILFILGFLFRPAAILLTCTMAVAVSHHYNAGQGFQGYSHALELGVVFLGLIFVGPGKLSIDGE
jgi:putative oxidoreductase